MVKCGGGGSKEENATEMDKNEKNKKKNKEKKKLNLLSYEGLEFLSIYKKPQVCGIEAAHTSEPYFFKKILRDEQQVICSLIL